VNYQEKVDTVRRRIFPRRESSASCDGKFCNSTCEGLDKCYVTEKSERQLDYILSSISTNIFLKACPGSGKTEVVGLKAAYEFHAWKQKNCGVAILTFTNNASDVIWDRVRQYAGLDKTVYPHFVGTIDSWLHGYLAHPFGHWITGYQGKTNDKSIRVVEDSVTGGWIKNYRCQTSYCSSPRNNNSPRVTPLYANMLRHNVETDGWEIKPLASSSEYQTDRDYYDSDGFKAFRSDKPWLTLECMRKDLSTSKTKFLRDGFATYHDVERICYCLLKERNDIAENLARRFPFIIVDECQDLSWIQLEILGLLKQAGITVHFVGDLNQAIPGGAHRERNPLLGGLGARQGQAAPRGPEIDKRGAAAGHLAAGQLALAHEIPPVEIRRDPDQRIIPAPACCRSLVGGKAPGLFIRIQQPAVQTVLLAHNLVDLEPLAA